MADAKTIEESLRALKDDFAAKLPSKLDKIEQVWNQASAENQEETIAELIFLCHKLAGSGASFGFQDVSKYARLAEEASKEIQKNSELNSNVSWADDLHPKLYPLINDLLKQKTSHQDNITQSKIKKQKIRHEASDEEKLLIYIIEKNRLTAEEITLKLKTYNYSVRSFSQLDDLKEAIIDNTPNAVIIDSTIFNTQTKTTINELRQDYQFEIIHLANNSSFETRLDAVRIGVDHYFTKPVDFSTVVDVLDILAEKDTPISTKVLIVDDSISTSQFYSLSLKAEGIETKVVTDPFKVMDEIIDFKPELILLDLHMPKCSGLELASVIRQQGNYLSTPIIFLSSETDTQKQLSALEIGADEFLNKPVNVDHLIAVVKNKIIRYRQLSTFMHNDSLTGLLNHTSILSTLDTELARAKRENSNFSYVMIDIDFFKNINDTYGHYMGDMVIKSISRYIKQNLRVTDSVGRYGGEEFVAILPGIDMAMATRVMQKILDGFSKVDFVHFNHKFNVSFSCGIADYSTSSTANEIIDAADKALYVAKNDGRHCIRTAT